MTTTTLARPHFQYQRSAVCIDCSAVFEITPTCPACGSEAVWSLPRWTDREGK
jgi:hypothetical protein